MRQRWGVIAVVAVLAFLSGGWLMQRGAATGGNVYQQARLFDDVLAHVNQYYVDSIGESTLYRKATDGLLSELHDPYSQLLVDTTYRQLTETLGGNYGGLGIQIDVRDKFITVVAPLPDTPAERAGIETGDRIVEVDGKSTEGWSSDEAVNVLRGPPGSTVRLTVERAGVASPLTFTLERAQIHVRSVPAGTIFPGGIGYISLNPVAESSPDELRDEVVAMQKKGMTSMVLDLRGNPGGLLEQGVDVADLFLDPKQEIVSTRGRARGSTREFDDSRPQQWPDLPIVVLVNEGTASAAEIIAGALQDHDRAVVVGTPTFGKGLVQTLFTLGDDVALKLTTARWYTPSGRTIQRQAADIEDQFALAENEAQGIEDTLHAAVDTAKLPAYHTDAGRVVRGGGGIVPDIIVRRDTLTADERKFVAAIGAKIPEYRDVLTAFALDMKRQGRVTAEDFQVTPEMLQDVRRRLTARGVNISEADFQGANRILREQLSYEVARYVFSREAEFRRRARDDRQLQTGMGLLRRASSPKDLMQLSVAERSGAPSSH